MYTNVDNIPLSLALWLAHDHYEAHEQPNTISATTIIKPLKQIILGMRVTPQEGTEDISTQLANRIGTAIHNGIEYSWKNKHKELMKLLNYPKKVYDRVYLNPTKQDLIDFPAIIPVYMEQRTTKMIAGINISGKFDFIIEGELDDFKTTSTYTWVHKTGNIKNALQGSIYKWLNQDKVTSNYISIQYIFKDWKAGMVAQDPKYPPRAIMTNRLMLKSIAETEEYLTSKINRIKALINSPEEDIPNCTSEDLWRKPSVFKYYKNPAKTNRSTKNFSTIDEANIRLAKDNNVGIVRESKGEVVACRYCSALNICKQKDSYILDGLLKI